MNTMKHETHMIDHNTNANEYNHQSCVVPSDLKIKIIYE